MSNLKVGIICSTFAAVITALLTIAIKSSSDSVDNAKWVGEITAEMRNLNKNLEHVIANQYPRSEAAARIVYEDERYDALLYEIRDNSNRIDGLQRYHAKGNQ